ncbi:hypothetical protein AKJ16_DCAP01658 [Drosera capensis]
MPSLMKIQSIDGATMPAEEVALPASETVKPVMKSRLRRLFRISGPEKVADDAATVAPVPVQLRKEGSGELELSSVCLDRMVQNFIEEGVNEKNQAVVKCGRSRCNCFNASDGSSDDEGEYSIPSSDVSDLLKIGLMGCVGVNEKSVMAETVKIVERNKAVCKRKWDFGTVVAEGLVAVGFDASVCKSKWEKSPSFPAGEYQYIDVIIEGERLIVDIDFRSEFEIAKATKAYKAILLTLPCIFVGKSDRLSRIITLTSEAAKQSLKKKGMHLPPWRKTEYVRAKWLSPHRRLTSNPELIRNTPTLTPAPMNSVNLDVTSGGVIKIKVAQTVDANMNPTSPEFETVFSMSESPPEDKVENVNVVGIMIPHVHDKVGSRVGTKVGGLASLMVIKP